jgi:hypothetical protein
MQGPDVVDADVDGLEAVTDAEAVEAEAEETA